MPLKAKLQLYFFGSQPKRDELRGVRSCLLFSVVDTLEISSRASADILKTLSYANFCRAVFSAAA